MKLIGVDVTSWHDLEYLYFLSCFPEVDITASDPAHFRVFLRRPCAHLETASGFGCRLHGTPEKPQTCVEFDESTCFYRHAFLGPPMNPSEVIRIDRARWLAIAPLYTLDSDGKVDGSPTLTEMAEAIRDVRGTTAAARSPEPQTSVTADPLPPRGFGDRSSPCSDCAAPCCRVLIFGRPEPRTADGLEFMRYQAGFPGVEIAVSEKGWRVLIQTSCMYFDANTAQCTLYGDPARPSLCTFYNQHVCDYRRFFSATEDTVLRLGAAELKTLITTLPDAAGRLPHDLSVARLREVLNG